MRNICSIITALIILAITATAQQVPIKNGILTGTIYGAPTSGVLNLSSVSVTLPTSALRIGTAVQAYDADLTTWAGITPGTGVGTFLATPSSANLAAAVTGETGSGALVFGTSPALVTPALGTPTALTLTNATGLPVSTGISGLGTGVATFLATPSSANLATGITDETGSGALVFGTSPTISAPTLNGTPTLGSALSWRTATGYQVGTKTTDQTKTSDAAMANDAEMTVALTAGTYRVSIMAIYANANASSQPQGKLVFSGSYTTAAGTLEMGSHSGAGIRGCYPNSTDADLIAPTFATTARDVWFLVQGVVVTTGSGTMAWNWAQYVSSANSITLKKGSAITVQKLD